MSEQRRLALAMWIYRGLMLLLACPLAVAALAEAVSDFRHADWPEASGTMADVRYAPVKRWEPPPLTSPSRGGRSLETRYDMAVRYEVDGRTYWHRRTGMRELPENMMMPVFHDPDDPRRATLSDPRVYSSRPIAIIAVVFLLMSLLPRRIVDRLTPTPRRHSSEEEPRRADGAS